MKKIKLHESQLISIIEHYLTEDFGMGNPNSNNTGAVELDKTKNPSPNDIKKYTSQGINVKLMDEELGEEEPLKFKHKFEDKNGKSFLNIYSSKDKIKLSDVYDYIISLKDSLKVQQALSNDNVNLYIKTPSSGRYYHAGSVSPDTYHDYLNLLKDNKSQKIPSEPEIEEPNKKIIKI